MEHLRWVKVEILTRPCVDLYLSLNNSSVCENSNDCYRLSSYIQPTTEPIKNQWGGYYGYYGARGRQISFIKKLKQQTDQRWFTLQLHILQKMVQGIPDTILKKIQRNGY